MSESMRSMAIKSIVWCVCGLFLTGCASLSKEECMAADWRTIGFEDGAKGRLLQRIGEHRESCAEYGIAPDFDAYRQGHQEGVSRYCNANVGYSVGRRGASYNGVCPSEFEAEFLGSANTLISPNVLKKLAFISPIQTNNEGSLKIYKQQEDYHYVQLFINKKNIFENNLKVILKGLGESFPPRNQFVDEEENKNKHRFNSDTIFKPI